MNTHTISWIIAAVIWMVMTWVGYRSNKKWMLNNLTKADEKPKWTNGDAAGAAVRCLFLWWAVLLWVLAAKTQEQSSKWEWWQKESKF